MSESPGIRTQLPWRGAPRESVFLPAQAPLGRIPLGEAPPPTLPASHGP